MLRLSHRWFVTLAARLKMQLLKPSPTRPKQEVTSRQRRRLLAAGLAGTYFATQVKASDRMGDGAAILRVGPGRQIPSPSVAARVARDGAIVEVDAGEYPGDVAVWPQARLTVRAVGGRVSLRAAGADAEGKAIWVTRVGEMTIEGFDFSGARVSALNGAGIRHERGHLTVRDCTFVGNQMGLLTSNDANAELHIEACEFAHNGAAGRHNHNLYVGSIGRFSIIGSYLHHGQTGHLLKSRARENEVRYNRLTDESGGRASYELEFPNGGLALVVGNLIAQQPGTENPILVSFGAEGYSKSVNELLLAFNTLVDGLPTNGRFIFARQGAARVVLRNNVFVGAGDVELPSGAAQGGNVRASLSDFADPAMGDMRFRQGSAMAAMRVVPVNGQDSPMLPDREYAHPRRTRLLKGVPTLPGAFQSLVLETADVRR